MHLFLFSNITAVLSTMGNVEQIPNVYVNVVCKLQNVQMSVQRLEGRKSINFSVLCLNGINTILFITVLTTMVLVLFTKNVILQRLW